MILLFTDTHLSDTNREYSDKAWDMALSLAKKHQCKHVVHLGDVFESRRSQTLENLRNIEQKISMFEDYDLHVLAGNHDKTDTMSNESWLSLYSLGRRKYFETNKARFHLLDYFDEGEPYLFHLEGLELSKNKKNILLTHIGVNEYFAGTVLQDAKISKIRSSIFQGFEKVYIGHYHNTKQFGNVIYTGSTFQASFGEDEQKGFWLLDAEGLGEFVPSNISYFKTVHTDTPTVAEVSKQMTKEGRYRIVTSAEILDEDKKWFLENNIKILQTRESSVGEVASVVGNYDLMTLFEKFCKKRNIQNEYGRKVLEKCGMS